MRIVMTTNSVERLDATVIRLYRIDIRQGLAASTLQQFPRGTPWANGFSPYLGVTVEPWDD
jgi:hypothetical protein